MAYNWQPQQFVPDYQENRHGNSTRTSNSSLPLTTDIDPASTWALSLGESQGHSWPGAAVSPQLDLAMTFAVPQEQLLITAHHVHPPFPTGSWSTGRMRNLTCPGPAAGMNDSAWSPHEDPFAGHMMGNMQPNFYPGSQVVETSMAPNTL